MRAAGSEEKSPTPLSTVEAADHIDPLRYDDPVCTCGEPFNLTYADLRMTNEQAAHLAADMVTSLMAKVDAGARLFFALYHHPQIVHLIGSHYWTRGMSKAYMAAGDAYLDGTGKRQP